LIKEYINKIFKDTGLIVILNVVNYSSSFLIAVMISRMLGIEMLGKYTFVIAASSIIYVICDFGQTTLIIRKIGADKKNAFNIIKKSNVLKIILLCAVALLLFIFRLITEIAQFDILFWLGLATVLPRLLQTSYEASIRVFGFQKYPTIIRSINSFFQVVAAYSILSSYGSLKIIFGMLLVFETGAVMFFYFFSKVLTRSETYEKKPGKLWFTFSEIKSTAKEGIFLFANNSLAISIPRIHILLIEGILSTVSVGIYSAAQRFISGSGLLTGALHNAYYPLLSNLKGDRTKAYQLTAKMISFSAIAGIISGALLFFLSDFLIDITFKTKEASFILKILSFGILPVLIYTVLQSYLVTFNREKYLFKLLSIVWVLNILLCFLLIMKFNLTGCAMTAVVIEYILMFGQLIYFFKHK
jgi:polysaccharide transporter, PST family